MDLIAPMPPANQTQNEKVGGLIPKKTHKENGWERSSTTLGVA